MGRQSRARRQRRTKIALGDPKPATLLGRPVGLPLNMQQRVYYLNVRTNQIAVVQSGQRLSAKSGFLICSRDTYRDMRKGGVNPTPVTMQQPVVEQPKPTISKRQLLAQVLGFNRRLAGVTP